MKISKKFYFLACILCISVCELIAMNNKSHAPEFCKDWIKKEEEKSISLTKLVEALGEKNNLLIEKNKILDKENKILIKQNINLEKINNNLEEIYNSYLVIDLGNHPIKVWTGTGLLIFSVIGVALGFIEIRFK